MKTWTKTDTHTTSLYVDRCNPLETAILELLNNRKQGASICPSEVARAVFGKSWREQMPNVRSVANDMTKKKQIEICQKGVVINPATAKGPIRLRIYRDQSK